MAIKIIAVTQARNSSTRLPGKVLLNVGGKSLLQIHIERIKKATLIDKLIVATTVNVEDKTIEDMAVALGCACYRGSEQDVLDRIYQAASPEKPDYVIRLTSDCPLIDPHLIDKIIEVAVSKEADYVSNTLTPTFPDGEDVEIIKFSALQRAWEQATLQSEREHVTPYIWKNSTFNGGDKFTSFCVVSETDHHDVRLTVDQQEDFEVITQIINKLGEDKTWEEYTQLYLKDKTIRELNNTVTRNEGYIKTINNDEL